MNIALLKKIEETSADIATCAQEAVSDYKQKEVYEAMILDKFDELESLILEA